MPVLLGIDIGGSGIKGNLVEPETGLLLAERFKVPTPQPSLPPDVANAVAEVASHFAYRGPIGCTFPAIVKGGVTWSAANVDTAWIGYDAAGLFGRVTGERITVINDADAAGMAEMAFGAGAGERGVVLVLTFGTGIGSALFSDGRLVPNTEFGHIELAGFRPVEQWAAARVRSDEDLTWEDWGRRVDRLLHHLEQVLSPDLFIIGGGVARRFAKFQDFLTVPVKTVAALLENEAGIVGAAMAAARSIR
ncbi:MAG TPA: ROK family protein [Acidimicrobiia bacterium]|jgi:polyphosphate glucokinase